MNVYRKFRSVTIKIGGGTTTESHPSPPPLPSGPGHRPPPLSVRAVVVGGRQENAYTDVLACGTHGVAAPLVQGLHASLDLDVDHLVPLPVFARRRPPPPPPPSRGLEWAPLGRSPSVI